MLNLSLLNKTDEIEKALNVDKSNKDENLEIN